jgi:CII-binding regulator of phage lambda lysogenization HflD
VACLNAVTNLKLKYETAIFLKTSTTLSSRILLYGDQGVLQMYMISLKNVCTFNTGYVEAFVMWRQNVYYM